MVDLNDAVDRMIDERGGRELLSPDIDQEAVQIMPFIYKSGGSTAAYVVVDGGERLILNTGKGAEGHHHRKLFDAVAPVPTRYIVTTQGHSDHVGGVAAFREPGAIYIAQENNAACQADNARIEGFRSRELRYWFQKNFALQDAISAEFGRPLTQDMPVADVTFGDRMRLRVGNLDVELLHAPGETVDSCVAWLPEHRICFSSNTFGPLFPHFPNLNTLRGDRYRFVEPYLSTIARVRDLGPGMLITGRGEPIVGADLIDACLDRLYKAVDYVHRETLSGMNAGVDLATLMRTITLPPQLRVGEGYGKVMWAVRTIWETYTGWFLRQSTTELYPTRANEAIGELVDAAGRAQVLERTRDCISQGRPLVAIHIAEALLDSDPVDRDAQQAMLDAHLALSAQVGDGNFWENGWIQYQLELWRDKLART